MENWRGLRTACYPEYCPINRRKDWSDRNDAVRWTGAFRNNDHYWFIAFRRISRATDRRSLVSVIGRRIAMGDSAFLIQMDHAKILQALRSISNSTNERTILVSHIPESAVGHSASVIDYECAQAVASALVLANMNSLPLDWAARLSMGGTNLSYFIMKQLPVLNPETFLYKSLCGKKNFELIMPRVLELTYTAYDLQGFAKDLGYNGPPFAWDDNRRHCLKCELDAIFAHMYQLERPDLEWILDAPPPGSSFPSLKNNEMKEFGEYRTKRYVLHAYDQLERGELPNVADVSP